MSRKTAERTGTMLVKMSAEVHGRVRVAAAVMGENIKQFVETAVERRLAGMREGVEAGRGGKRRVVEVAFEGDEAAGSGLVVAPAERGEKTARARRVSAAQLGYAGVETVTAVESERALSIIKRGLVADAGPCAPDAAVPVALEDDEPFNPGGGGIPEDYDPTVHREYLAQPRPPVDDVDFGLPTLVSDDCETGSPIRMHRCARGTLNCVRRSHEPFAMESAAPKKPDLF